MRRSTRSLAACLVVALYTVACGTEPSSPAASAPAAGPVASGAQPKPAPQLTPIKVAFSVTILPYAPMIIAQKKGFFRQHGLDPTFVDLSGGSTTIEALQNGSIDFAVLSGSNVILAHAKGATAPLAVAGVSTQMALYTLMRADLWMKQDLSDTAPLSQRLAALKGRTAAITSAGSITDSLLRLYANEGGFDPKEIRMVSLGGPAALISALQHGQVDVTSVSPPFAQEALGAGYAHLLLFAGDLPLAGEIAYGTLVTSHNLAAQHPDEVKATAAAVADGIALAHDHPDEALAVLQQAFPKVGADVLRASLTALAPSWPPKAAMTEEQWKNFEQLMRETGELKGTAPSTADGTMWTGSFTP